MRTFHSLSIAVDYMSWCGMNGELVGLTSCQVHTARPHIRPSPALYNLHITYTHMKNISLRDEVYEELSRLKREGESFSDVILRLLRKNRERSLEILRRYAGKLKDSGIEEIIMEERARFRVRDFDL